MQALPDTFQVCPYNSACKCNHVSECLSWPCPICPEYDSIDDGFDLEPDGARYKMEAMNEDNRV
jgi:hypothetical protein